MLSRRYCSLFDGTIVRIVQLPNLLTGSNIGRNRDGINRRETDKNEFLVDFGIRYSLGTFPFPFSTQVVRQPVQEQLDGQRHQDHPHKALNRN